MFILLIFLATLIQLVNGAKIGIFISTMSKSQIIFGYQIATVLSSDNHDVVIIRPDINPYIYEFKPGKFREIQLNALKSSGNAVFEEFRRVRDESIFGDQTFLSGKTIGLPSVFYKLMTTTCLGKLNIFDFNNTYKYFYF
jgi:hypothetical protein